MFPVSFEYLKVHSAEEALAALQQHGGDARVLAGGQSLIPAMRYRLARPAFLVDFVYESLCFGLRRASALAACLAQFPVAEAL